MPNSLLIHIVSFPLLEIPFLVCNVNRNALFLCLIRKGLLCFPNRSSLFSKTGLSISNWKIISLKVFVSLERIQLEEAVL